MFTMQLATLTSFNFLLETRKIVGIQCVYSKTRMFSLMLHHDPRYVCLFVASSSAIGP